MPRPMATLAGIPPLIGSVPVGSSPGGYPWQDGDILYADDLNAAFLPSSGGIVTGRTSIHYTHDWLTPMISWPNSATLGLYAVTDGGIAITGASHNQTAPPGDAAIGVAGFGFNDQLPSVEAEPAWGGYFEARYYPGVTNNTYGVEIDIANVSGVAASYTSSYGGAAPFSSALLLASGAEVSADTPPLTASSASAALWITDNGAPFRIGIGFKATSLVGTNGNDSGTGVALSLAKGHQVLWSKPDGTPAAAIYSVQDNSGTPISLIFGNEQVALAGAGLALTDVTGINRLITGASNTSPRWAMAFGNTTAETGGNAGSDFQIDAHKDDGTYLSTALLIKRSTGLMQIAGLLGTTTNDNATAGQVGEYITASIGLPGTAISSGVYAALTSITLSPGDWDVSGFAGSAPAAGCVQSLWQGGPSSSNTAFASYNITVLPVAMTAGLGAGFPFPTFRVSAATNTTVQLGVQVSFSGGTCAGYGTLSARRVR